MDELCVPLYTCHQVQWMFRLSLQEPVHKVLTYIEYRAVFGIFQTIDSYTPLSTQRVCPPPHHRRRVHTRRAVRGWRVKISEDARHWIGLLQYNPSTSQCFQLLLQVTPTQNLSQGSLFLETIGFRHLLVMLRKLKFCQQENHWIKLWKTNKIFKIEEQRQPNKKES